MTSARIQEAPRAGGKGYPSAEKGIQRAQARRNTPVYGRSGREWICGGRRKRRSKRIGRWHRLRGEWIIRIARHIRWVRLSNEEVGGNLENSRFHLQHAFGPSGKRWRQYKGEYKLSDHGGA